LSPVTVNPTVLNGCFLEARVTFCTWVHAKLPLKPGTLRMKEQKELEDTEINEAWCYLPWMWYLTLNMKYRH